MNDKKPGLIRRTFRFLGKVGSAIRSLINLVILLVFILIIASLFQEDIQPLPEKAALRVAPGGVIVEQKTYMDPLQQLMRQNTEQDAETLLSDLIESITQAASDERITALVLELDYLVGGGISKMEEIGHALEKFKESGKPVIAVGDNFTQDQYYLASYADEIHLNPMGAVLITGYGSYPTYLKDALEKLKVNVNVFRVGEYKDAIEPFIRNDMSQASREHNLSWLGTLWNVYTSRIENQRNIPSDAINDYVNNLDNKLIEYNGDSAKLALEASLVDHISTRPEMLQRLRTLSGAKDNNGYQHINFQTYQSHLNRTKALQPSSEQDKIGVIVAKGAIFDGEQPRGSIGGDTLARLLRQASQDKKIKALVLRIDSPGGSAFASEVIRQEIAHTQSRGIPVVVSMGSLAASGGYWISATADQVWATPTTLTGSIGVFGIVPTFENSLDSLGISSDGVGTTLLADLYHLDRPMSGQAKKILQLSVDNIYDRFLSLVAEGRSSSAEEIHKIAQGRVWSGMKACKLGLVDELGSLQDAIEATAKLAKLENYRVETISKPLNVYEQLMQELTLSGTRLGINAGSSERWLPTALFAELRPLVEQLDFLRTLNDPRNVYAQCLVCAAP